MCYLGYLPRRTAIETQLLRNAYDHNSDGFGVMYAENGRVVSWKQKGKFDVFEKHWATLPDNRQIAVHFRFGTSGPDSAEACHPFEVLNKDRDGMDLWLMHNGVLDRNFPGNKKSSDTMQYVHKLRGTLQGKPELIRNGNFREFLEIGLPNPNKMLLLEGSGRWHFLNKEQGKEKGGVWHSNEYSLAPVYSGHGKGKAANSSRYMMDWDDDYTGTSYHGGTGVTVYRSGAGNLESKRMDKAYAATIGVKQDDGLTWALQVLRQEGKDEEQRYWKKGYSGWLRMGRNPNTGGFYREYLKAHEKNGFDDFLAILPPNCIKFRPKNETAWERGDKHTWTMVRGEHVPVPVMSAATNMLVTKPTTAAGAQLPTSTAYLCRETNEPCMAGCTTQCVGATAEPVATFSQPKDDAGITARLATLEEVEEASDDDYAQQLFSEFNMSTMSEAEMIEAIEAYPEYAAIALGYSLGLKWAFDEKVQA